MLKRVFTLVFLFVVFTSLQASGETLSASLPCEGGGSIDISGSYNVITGAIDLSFVFDHCEDMDGQVINGTLHTTGVFRFTSANTASVDLDSTSDFTITGTGNLSAGCTNSVNGTYNLDTLELSGKVSSSCSGNGKITVDLLALLYGMDAYLY